VVDFGVDETWEPAPSRRRRAVESIDAADRVASPVAERPSADRSDRVVSRRSRAADADRGRAARPRAAIDRSASARPVVGDDSPWTRAVVRDDSPSARAVVRDDSPSARSVVRDDRSLSTATRGSAVLAEEFGAVAVSVDVLAHPAHLPVSEPPAGPSAAGSGIPGRRTVTIRGHGAERELAFPQNGRARRPAVRRHERPGFQPDRTALWALMLGVVLVLVAATSSHAATLSHIRATRSAALHATVTPAPAARMLVLHSGR
jgi:hypothetical protein